MLGYRVDREDWDYLRDRSVEFPAACCAAGDVPDEFRPKLRTKMQARTNSCVGHALSTLFAALNLLITGEEVDYSAWFAYLVAQAASDMLGADQGATIAGAMRAGHDVGCCRDELLPFPGGRYLMHMPPAAQAEAKQHQLGQFTELRGYDSLWRFVSTHQGPMLIGTPWREGQVEIGPDGLETRKTALKGAMLGYHARCIIGWSKRLDDQGRHFLRCKNSHSERWGDQGESDIEPALFDEWANDRFSAFFGASESRPFEPRPVAWKEQRWIVV